MSKPSSSTVILYLTPATTCLAAEVTVTKDNGPFIDWLMAAAAKLAISTTAALVGSTAVKPPWLRCLGFLKILILMGPPRKYDLGAEPTKGLSSMSSLLRARDRLLFLGRHCNSVTCFW